MALERGVGFLAAYRGAPSLTEGSLVRLGGDGRGARIRIASAAALEPDWQRIEKEGRFRLLLTTPGLFENGWQPDGVPATLVAASVNRFETISGWDIRDGINRPKPAQRVAPTGSVYWFDKLASLPALKELFHNGLDIADPARRAEGFNQCSIAPWAEET